MDNNNWSKWAEDIKATVQSSIESKDFSNLSESVGSIVNTAVKNVSDGLKNANIQWQQTVKQYPQNQKTQAPTVDEEKQQKALKKQQAKDRKKLFGDTSSDMSIGVVMAVFGLLGSWVFGAGVAVSSVTGFVYHSLNGILAIILTVLFGALFVGCLSLAVKGFGRIGLASRCEKYVKQMGDRSYCSVEELAKKMDKSVSYVQKDLRAMLQKGYFPQGRMDDQEKCLMLDDATYQQYLVALQQYQEQERQKQMQASADDGLPEKVKQVTAEGEQFLTQIHKCNDAIPGQEISAKITRMEQIIDKIFKRIKEKPELVGEVKQLMGYYLPTTVKLLDAYQDLEAQPVQGPNITRSKKEIEDTLDTLNSAFENLLDSFYQNTAWDISSDISVMKTMLAQEGLTNSDFTNQEDQSKEKTT